MKRGFSLVELSIVLVILGLLVGGVLSGQSLIRAAELRSITADVSRYQTAVRAYSDKYLALPGDQSNAFQWWGTAASCTNTLVTDSNPNGCNGNGDGKINCYFNYNDCGSTTGKTSAEGWRAWQFLAVAGLIEGRYSGIADPATTTAGWEEYDSSPGVNVPASKISPGGYQLFWIDSTLTSYYWHVTPARGNQYIILGTCGTAAGAIECTNGLLKGIEGWNIDTKLDDGIANTGKIYGRSSTTNIVSSANYLTETGTVAMLFGF